MGGNRAGRRTSVEQSSLTGAVSPRFHLQDPNGRRRVGDKNYVAFQYRVLQWGVPVRQAAVSWLESQRSWVRRSAQCISPFLRRVLLYDRSTNGDRCDGRVWEGLRAWEGHWSGITVGTIRYHALNRMEAKSQERAVVARRDHFSRHRTGVCDRDAVTNGESRRHGR